MRIKRRLPKVKLSEKLKNVLKWVFFGLFALILFAFSTSGSPYSSKAIALLPFAVAIACFTPEWPSAIAGGVCGMLVDISCDKTLGFTGLYLCLICGLVSAMFRQLLRKNIINYLVAAVLFCAVYLYIDYFFFYRIWDYPGYQSVLSQRLWPSYFKTLLWSPLMYFVVWLATRLSVAKRELALEGENKKIDRI